MDPAAFLADLEAKPAALRALADRLDGADPWTPIEVPQRIVLIGMGSSRYAAGVAATRLRAAGIEHARMAAITLDQPDAAARSVQVLRAMSPDLPVLVRARDVAQAEQLAGAGATEVVPEIVEGSLQLGEMLLRRLGATRDEVDQVLDEFRRRTYSRLSDLIRGQPVELGPSVGSDQV